MKTFPSLFCLISAVLLSAVAEYFSIVGLASTFPGAVISVYVMGAVVGIAKIVMVIWLHQNWKEKLGILRLTNVVLVSLAMLLTSMGVFGFLAKANIQHEATSTKANQNIQAQDTKLSSLKEQLADVQRQKQIFESGLNSLIDQKSVTKAFKQVEAQKKNRKALYDQEKVLRDEILLEEGKKLDSQLEVKNVEAEIGPIIYLADLLYGESNQDTNKSAVKIFIIVLVLLLDPLAVCLLISAQIGYNIARKNDEVLPVEIPVTSQENTEPMIWKHEIELPVQEEEKEESFLEQAYSLPDSPVKEQPKFKDKLYGHTQE